MVGARVYKRINGWMEVTRTLPLAKIGQGIAELTLAIELLEEEEHISVAACMRA